MKNWSRQRTRKAVGVERMWATGGAESKDSHAEQERMNSFELIEKAKTAAQYRKLTDECIIGEVGAVLLTSDGNLYTGVSISAASGIGFCAEHSAIAQMLTAGETRIQKAVAVSADGKIMPPCGRCREFFYQINRDNLKTEIILSVERSRPLAELLPERWQELW